MRGQRKAAAIRERECMMQLVETAVAAQVERQRSRGDGLFVDLALYGDGRAITCIAAAALAVASDPRTGALVSDPRVIDVTAPLAAIIDIIPGPGGHGSGVQLALPPGSKRNLEGFWDPCEGSCKNVEAPHERAANTTDQPIPGAPAQASRAHYLCAIAF